MNARFVLVAGAGPRGQAFAATLESHRELGLKVVGFIDDDKTYAEGARWPWLGTLADTESVLNERVVDEVAICLPFSQWQYVDGIAHIAEEAGKIVRVPIDMLGHAFAAGKVEDLDGTAVYSLVSGPDRVMALAFKRVVDIVIAGLGLIAAIPIFAAIAWAIKREDGGPVLFSQERAGLHGRTRSTATPSR
jgi:hypothetical protein